LKVNLVLCALWTAFIVWLIVWNCIGGFICWCQGETSGLIANIIMVLAEIALLVFPIVACRNEEAITRDFEEARRNAEMMQNTMETMRLYDRLYRSLNLNQKTHNWIREGF
jgi:hypothetical protein